MQYGQYDRDEQAKGRRLRKQGLEKDWNMLRQTERKFYSAVAAAWRRNKLDGRWDKHLELPDWITRQQIADELGADRLNPYNVKLLQHLSGGKSPRDSKALHWIHKAKRTRWRETWEGIARPAGYEWVYHPDEDTLNLLTELEVERRQAEQEAGKPAQIAAPRQPMSREDLEQFLGRMKANRSLQPQRPPEPEGIQERVNKWIKDKLFW